MIIRLTLIADKMKEMDRGSKLAIIIAEANIAENKIIK